MRYETITPDALAWDAFVRGHERGHILQLSAWGSLKAEFGWQPVRVALTHEGQIISGAQLLLRAMPFNLGKLAYIPYAPLVDWHNPDLLKATFEALHEAAKQHRAILLKVEPGYDLDPAPLKNLGFKLSPQTVQPPNSIWLDLSADEATILARMNQGTRRNIRKSQKFEVVVREGTRADVNSFNAMLDETGERGAFGVHVARYYERAYDLFVPQGDAVLLMASYDDQDLAGVFVFKLGKEAYYFYGASRDIERQRMAAYAVQWSGIEWARAAGGAAYDLYGVPDADPATLEAEFESRQDGLWGVYRFKRGWGGEVKRGVGAWDYVYNRPLYALYQLALKLRRSRSNGE